MKYTHIAIQLFSADFTILTVVSTIEEIAVVLLFIEIAIRN
ncbi:hypothetical protein ymoll0001_32790 [Yersinia mollaretii ATCC 43969]|uniref:Uncharacterized protein n=1 Tax=Yersinia mollaretii (strain ATCC 43969 / DSM 18520 / CIP 103324 / CNY 7263 / WAIP 204) TaxID=349967 RepID=A0ABP2E930_YERMW|nr:hypothetical protein ymoll0001_32790 [Yersinia mollaretii ATCC 43969]